MSTLQRATRNSVVMMTQQIVTWGATFLLMAVLARYLGDAGFGTLFLAMSFAVIFQVIVDFGLDEQLVRGVARDRSAVSRYFANSVVLKSVSAVFAYGLILVVINVLNYDPEVQATIAIFCIVLFFDGISKSLVSVYQAHEQLFHSATGTIVEKVSIMIGALILVYFGHGVVAVAGVYVLGSILGMIWRLTFVFRLTTIEFTFSWQVARGLIIAGVPFFMFWTLRSVYHRVDAVMLSSMTDAAVVGWYGSAYRLFDTLGFLPFIVSTMIMLPILSRLSQDSSYDLRFAAGKALNAIIIIGVPICVGLAVLAEPIIGIVYGGGNFLNAVPALQLLALALLIIYINSIFASVIISVNLERKMTLVAALAVGLNVGLNFLFIPAFQHVGAAATTVITELFIVSCLMAFTPREVRPWECAETFAKAAIAAAFMAVVLYVLRGFHIALLVPIGGAVYVAVGLLLRVAPPEDLRILLNAVKQKQVTEGPEREASQA